MPTTFTKSKIKSIKPIGKKTVWDISVEEDNSYLAQGFVNHNSRIAVASPNLQNIPARKKVIKSFFIPSFVGGCIMQGDLSQAELRILACASKDKTLLKVYREDRDLHTEVAALVLDISPEKVTPEDRTAAKAINFGLIYGRQAASLAQETGKTKQEAQAFINEYFIKLPDVARWLQDTPTQAKKTGYVETLFGFRRRLPGIVHQIKEFESSAERQAKNTPIQGTSAMFTIYVLCRIHDRLKKEGLQSKLIITVHDSFVLDVHPDEINSCKEIMLSEAEHKHFDWQVIPMKLDIGIGPDYGQIEDI